MRYSLVGDSEGTGSSGEGRLQGAKRRSRLLVQVHYLSMTGLSTNNNVPLSTKNVPNVPLSTNCTKKMYQMYHLTNKIYTYCTTSLFDNVNNPYGTVFGGQESMTRLRIEIKSVKHLAAGSPHCPLPTHFRSFPSLLVKYLFIPPCLPSASKLRATQIMHWERRDGKARASSSTTVCVVSLRRDLSFVTGSARKQKEKVVMCCTVLVCNNM